MAYPLDASTIAELVDAIHVAVGLRLVAVVLYGPAASGKVWSGERIDLLVVAEELPPDTLQRGAYLERLCPPGTLEGTNILFKTPEEFQAEPEDTYRQMAATARILFDSGGFVSARFARLV